LPGKYSLADIEESPKPKGMGRYSLADIEDAPQPKPVDKAEPSFGSRLYDNTIAGVENVSSGIQTALRSRNPVSALVGATARGAGNVLGAIANTRSGRAGNPIGGVAELVAQPIVDIGSDLLSGNVGAAAGGAAALFGPSLVGRLTKPATAVARRVQQSALNPPAKFSDAQVARLVDESLEQGVTATNRGKATALRKQAAQVVKDRVAMGDQQGFTVDPKVAAMEIDTVKTGARGMQSDAAKDLALVDAKRQRILDQNPAPMSFGEAQARKQADYKVNQKIYGANSADVLPAAEAETLAAYDRGIRKQMETLDPALGPKNDTLGARIDLEKVVRRTAQKQANSPIFGFGDIVAGALGGYGGVEGAAAAVVARKVLTNPAVKSRLAITIYDGAKAAGQVIPFTQATARAAAIINSLMPPSGAEKELDAIKNKEKK